MTVLESVRNWLKDPFGVKQKDQQHVEIQRELQILRGQVGQKTKDLTRHPYRALHKDFRQKEGEANVRVYE